MTRREFLASLPVVLTTSRSPRDMEAHTSAQWEERLVAKGHQLEMRLDLGDRRNAVVIEAWQDGPPLSEDEVTRARGLARRMLLDWAATGRPGRLCPER